MQNKTLYVIHNIFLHSIYFPDSHSSPRRTTFDWLTEEEETFGTPLGFRFPRLNCSTVGGTLAAAQPAAAADGDDGRWRAALLLHRLTAGAARHAYCLSFQYSELLAGRLTGLTQWRQLIRCPWTDSSSSAGGKEELHGHCSISSECFIPESAVWWISTSTDLLFFVAK